MDWLVWWKSRYTRCATGRAATALRQVHKRQFDKKKAWSFNFIVKVLVVIYGFLRVP